MLIIPIQFDLSLLSLESKRWNASSCNNTIDKAGDGSYEKVGKGLTTLSREDSDVSCFDFDEDTGTITAFTCLLSVSYYEDPALNTGYNDYKDVVIPAKINDIDVRAIGLWAFWSLKITSLIIPDSVTSIWLWAFSRQLFSLNYFPFVTLGVTEWNNFPLTIFPNKLLPSTFTYFPLPISPLIITFFPLTIFPIPH